MKGWHLNFDDEILDGAKNCEVEIPSKNFSFPQRIFFTVKLGRSYYYDW